MTITLIEKINKDKLKRVINSDNLPCNSLEDDPDWVFKSQPTILKKLYHRVDEDNNHITTYNQRVDNYGRFKSTLGIQGIHNQIRSYICGEYYKDVDIKNCHPKIIEHLFNKHGVYSSFIIEYNEDRNKCIKKYGLNNKLDIIKLINTHNLFSKYEDSKYMPIKDFHTKLYDLFTTTIYKENKELFKTFVSQLKKDGKASNLAGSIMAKYLQNIENDLMICIKKYFTDNRFKVSVLMYDGVMVENHKDLTQDVLDSCAEYLKQETQYDLQLDFKPTETDWIPNELKTLPEHDNPKFNKNTCAKLYEESFIKDKKGNKKIPELWSVWMEYMNRYLCVFNSPHVYGWRFRTTDQYDFRQSAKIKERIGVKYFSEWNDDEEQKVYDKMDFIPDINFSNDEWIYNNYIRPTFTKPEGEITELCPKFFEFMDKVICNGYKDAENWVYNWISQMIRKGFTRQAVVLLGEKGCGKSSFAEILGDLVGKDYTLSLDNIDRVGSNFNSIFYEKILTTVQEISSGAADYHRLQTIIKSRTTEEEQIIEKKGVDGFKVKSSNNFIFITNELNPIKITGDNRRFLPLKVSTIYQRNTKFFKELKKEVSDNIEYLRYWFIHRSYDYSNQEQIPKTNCIKELTELNKSCIEKFIDERINSLIKNDPDDRTIKDIYGYYMNYRFEEGDNSKPLSLKYFKAEIENKTRFKFVRKTINKIEYRNLMIE